ncbi:MAG: rhamnogalacturonan lyase [Ruminococcus sp.]|nr:rhamnogalacturonan lyase [Ruminococcus sp.]
MKKAKRFLGAALSLCIAAGVTAPLSGNYVADAASGPVVEYLDRGVSAVNTGSGMLVSWRYLANDDDNAVFKLYRDDTLIYTSNAGDATCWLDAEGTAASSYKVETVVGGTVISTDKSSMISESNYFDIPLDLPTSSGCTYSPNDCSVGDVDGDGEYELFVKWDPSNSKDNSQKGKTDKVYIDCYKLDGTKLWRIDLGVNIRAGAHYTQFFVADFDLDGRAEMTCKTADGTIDGQGNAIGDKDAVYRNGDGLILTGPEYYTLFDGATGAALDTIDYEVGRGDTTKWGKSSDKFNRVDRFWGCVAYLDGQVPSVVTGRGYYGRMTATAYRVENKKLVKQWLFDTGTSSGTLGYGDGNHNSMPADVDGDGRQEIITGSTCIDDNGELLWCINKGHGDAMHVGDLDTDNSGLEAWICHEDSPYGVSLVDCDTGKILFHNDGSGDTGRCCGDNIWAGNDGAELWGNKESDGSTPVKDTAGNTLSCNRPAINFLSYWDGDLEREVLDGYTDSPATISKMNEKGKMTTLLSTDGYYTCNTTKGTPCLSADIFGDWREELVVRAADSKSVRIYATTYDTDYRITTLMHDPQYRNQVASQNVAYNQPPHASFYLGSDEPLPSKPDATVNEDPEQIVIIAPAKLTSGAVYRIRNKNSGQYLSVDGNAANQANVIQSADSESRAGMWKAVPASVSGYYYMYSMLGDGATYCLDLTAGKTENGTNIEIYKSNNKDPQQFMFVENADGDAYTIRPKNAYETSGLGVQDMSSESGANVLLWELNGTADQEWILEKTSDPGSEMDTGKVYMFKNANSGMYMEVESAGKADGTNVQQWGADSAGSHNSWNLMSAGNGYYTVCSQMSDGSTWYLTVENGGSASGDNAAIYTADKSEAQQFKFKNNLDGTYTILTRSTDDACALGVASASTSSGGNVVQWTSNSSNDQKWIIEEVGTIERNIKGDVDNDGSLNISDVVMLQKWLINAGDITNPSAADVDANGVLNVFDLCIIKRMLIG